MIRSLITASMVSAVFATACTHDQPEYEDEEEMSPERLAAIREHYHKFLAQEGIEEFVGDVAITPVSGFLDFRADGTKARDMVATLKPVESYLVTNSGAFLDQFGPFRLVDGNPFWWPMDFTGLDRHPVEEWPQVAFFDVTAEIAGLPVSYRALVFRRASGYAHIVDPVLDVQPLMRVTATTADINEAADGPDVYSSGGDGCRDINATGGRLTNSVQVDCVIDWAPDHTLRWEVEWALSVSATCTPVDVDGYKRCAVQNPNARTAQKEKRFYYDGELKSGFGTGYTCDYWGPTKIYYKAEVASDDKEDTYRDEFAVPSIPYGAHVAHAGGLRVLGQDGPWGTGTSSAAIAWLPLITGTAAGTTILYHAIRAIHWLLSDVEAPPQLVDSDAKKLEANYECVPYTPPPTPPSPTPSPSPSY